VPTVKQLRECSDGATLRDKAHSLILERQFGPNIAYVEFNGPRTGEFLAAAEVRATLANSP